MTDEYTGRVFRHTHTDELLWVTSQREWVVNKIERVLCEALCLTGPNTGHTRTLAPNYIDDWCELVTANYEYSPGGTELALEGALLQGIVAVPQGGPT